MNNSKQLSNSRKPGQDDTSHTRTFSDFTRKAKLAPIQQDLYLYNLIYPGSNTFNIGFSVNLGTDVDRAKWETAVKWILLHDDITRTYIISHDDEPYQVIDSQASIFFEYVELTESLTAASSAKQYLWEQNEKLIDLSTPPLFRNYLIKDKHKEYTAGFLMPHILFDGIAAQAFFSRVDSAYSVLLQEKSLEETKFPSFYDYVENDYPVFDRPETEEYWSKKLKNVLSFDFLPSAGGSKKNLLKEVCLDTEETSKIKEFCSTHKCRLPTFFMTVYGLLLQRYADCEEDFVVFNILAGRTKEHLSTFGCFYKVLPYVFPKDLLSNGESVHDILNYIAQYRKNLGSLQDISFPLSTQILRNPKVKCFYSYKSFALVNLLGEKRTIDVYYYVPDDEIHLSVLDIGESIKLELYYNENNFPDCSFLERLRYLALQVCQKTSDLSDLNILLEKERDHLTAQTTLLTAELGPAVMIHKQFEAQAALYPDKAALTSLAETGCLSCTSAQAFNPKESLTYRELNEQANQLAHYLQELGIGPDDLVALCLDRSVDLVVAILGIVKTGGAYVPLDPDYPQERLDFMLKDSAVSVLVTQESLAGRFSRNECKIVCLDSDRDSIQNRSKQNPISHVNFYNIAYIIYTSGSTGKPKGVLVTHGNVARLFLQTDKCFSFNNEDVWTLFHSCSFDFSVWELWGALIYGGRLVIIPKAVSRSPDAFYDVLHKEKVTVLNQTPTAFYNLMRAESSQPVPLPLVLRYVIFGGEALDLRALKPWVDRHGDLSPRLINMYGITETTVHVTYRPIKREDIEQGLGSVIGGAIPDLRIYLLDKKQRPVPTGLSGEICIGGAGVARGYLNRPDLTLERFIPNPFTSDPNSLIYRSGDLGRILPNGDIEYLGRIDDQVKIRGFRIELGEISATLLNHVSVAQAVVVSNKHVTGDSGKDPAEAENRLVAYVVPSNSDISFEDLRAYLRQKLPDYMAPSYFVQLESLPLTPNGKVDKKALPEPKVQRHSNQELILPQTDIEKVIASAWCEILSMEEVSIYDNFFDLGGHSLSATRIIRRITEDLGINLPLNSIYENPTLKDLAEFIETFQWAGHGDEFQLSPAGQDREIGEL